jgi:hypothetical protein
MTNIPYTIFASLAFGSQPLPQTPLADGADGMRQLKGIATVRPHTG